MAYEYDGWTAEPQETQEAAPLESDPGLPGSAAEPGETTGEASTPGSDTTVRKPVRARKTMKNGVRRADVQRILDLAGRLDDERIRRIARITANGDADADLIIALLDNRLTPGMRILTEAHGQADPIQRAISLVEAVTRDRSMVRIAARIALALDPDAKDAIHDNMKDMDLAAALANVAAGLDVTVLEGLVR